ncbi:hypothetical protein, partial [Aneurinibacillus danicus]|uniref:hypothetical protein n=1 Tax=Aneurinibacillus danicus TaxID=267746 RepID=UPI001C3F7C11
IFTKKRRARSKNGSFFALRSVIKTVEQKDKHKDNEDNPDDFASAIEESAHGLFPPLRHFL